MGVAARINPTWRNKWLIVATVMMGYGGLCIYDYYVAYPAHDQRWEKHRDLTEGAGDSGKMAWKLHAESQGWPIDPPAEPHLQKDQFGNVIKDDYATQIWQLALVWTLGIAGYGWVIFNSRRRLVAEEDYLLAPSGEKVPYDSMTKLDKTRWDRKGIAYVYFKDTNGETGRVKLDDWIYRDADLVLQEIEERSGLTGDEEEEVATT